MKHKSTLSQLGDFIREFRQRHGLTQRELQAQLGEGNWKYISLIEAGYRQRPHYEFLSQLSNITGTPIEKLVAMSQTPSVLIRGTDQIMPADNILPLLRVVATLLDETEHLTQTEFGYLAYFQRVLPGTEPMSLEMVKELLKRSRGTA